MAYSNVSYTGDGATTTFAIPFPYILKTHVTCKVAGITTSFTWPTTSTATISPAPANGATVVFTRASGIASRLVTFADGGTPTADVQNEDGLQAVYLIQELVDQVAVLAVGAGVPITSAVLTVDDEHLTVPNARQLAISGGSLIDSAGVLTITVDPPAGGSMGVIQAGQGTAGRDYWQTPQEINGPISAGQGAVYSDSICAIPFFVPATRTLAAVGLSNAGAKAGKVVRVGLYRAVSKTDIYPGALAGSADIPLDNGSQWVSAALPATITGGYVYWLAFACNTSGTTINLIDNRSWWCPLGIAALDNGNSNPYFSGFRIVQAFDVMPSTFPVVTPKEYNGTGALIQFPSIGMKFSG